MKVIVFLIIILNISQPIYSKNFGMRCKRPKAYAFCGSHTVVGTQWFFDSKHAKCLPYKYCLSSREMENPEESLENRFESEMQCQHICKLKKSWPSFKKFNKNSKRKKKGISLYSGDPDALGLQDDREKRFESKDPFRCMKPKSYSFCGSHTIPRTHWYYNKHMHRCLPYKYCETIEEIPAFNNENNFYSEKQCRDICHFYY